MRRASIEGARLIPTGRSPQRGSASKVILERPSHLERALSSVPPRSVPASSVAELAPLPATGHDIIAIGASAGGVEAITRLVELLPEGYPAAIFVVIHITASATSVL